MIQNFTLNFNRTHLYLNNKKEWVDVNNVMFEIMLKVKSCKSYNEKYMIATTKRQDFLVLSHKVLFINKKDNRNC